MTSMQLTTAISCIANGGEYAQPLIARDIVDGQGHSVKSIRSVPLRRVVQKKTALQLRDMMQLVTQEGGTGTSAVPEGYTVAGKTGTAQILDPQTKRYAAHKHTASFTGFIPADQPRLVITVVIHEPQGSMYGGVVSAPVFRNIAARALPYLGVMPAQNIAPPGVRSVKAGVGGKTPTLAVVPVSVKATAQPREVKGTKAAPPPHQVKSGKELPPSRQVKSAKPEPGKCPPANAVPVVIKRTTVKAVENMPARPAGYALQVDKRSGSKID